METALECKCGSTTVIPGTKNHRIFNNKLTVKFETWPYDISMMSVEITVQPTRETFECCRGYDVVIYDGSKARKYNIFCR